MQGGSAKSGMRLAKSIAEAKQYADEMFSNTLVMFMTLHRAYRSSVRGPQADTRSKRHFRSRTLWVSKSLFEPSSPPTILLHPLSPSLDFRARLSQPVRR